MEEMLYPVETFRVKEINLPGLGNLAALSQTEKIYLVLLRHFGCAFSHDTLLTLATEKEKIVGENARIILVHMADPARAAEILLDYGLESVDAVSDPDRDIYQKLGLRRGSFSKVFGLRIWWKAFKNGLKNGHPIGSIEGDLYQMPGIFVIEKGKVVSKFVHKTIADTPDYYALAACESPVPKTTKDN